MNFVAFDFETANPKRNSACSIALSVVRNGQIVDEFYSLINPQADFAPTNIRVHGIKLADVINAPTFSELWPHIETFTRSALQEQTRETDTAPPTPHRSQQRAPNA